MDIQPFVYFGKKYAKIEDSYWLLLFHHNHSISAYFSSMEEAKNVDVPGKYSILYLLNDKYRTMKNSSPKYEFIINYPSYYFRWRQTKNPLKETDFLGISNVTGYEPIHVTHNPQYFGGLAVDHNRTETLLNGNVGHVNWCVSIGMQKSALPSWISGGFPAACEAMNLVDLWVKLPTISSINMQRSTYFLRLFLLIFLLIS